MIIKYKRDIDKIIAMDDELGEETYDYQNNIDEYLIQKNIVEKLEKDIAYLEYVKDDLVMPKNIILTVLNKYIFPVLYCASIVIGLAFPITNFSLMLIGTIALHFGTNKIFDKVNKTDILRKKYKVLDNSIEGLNVLLQKEEDKLLELVNSKEQQEERNIEGFRIRSALRLHNIQKLESLYMIGWTIGDKFHSYAKDCVLHGKIEEVSNTTSMDLPITLYKDDINRIDDIVKEKKLIKKR